LACIPTIRRRRKTNEGGPDRCGRAEQSEPPWRAPANFPSVKTFFDSALSSFTLSFRRARVLVFPFSAQPPSLGHSPPHGFTVSIKAEPRHALTFGGFFQKSLRWCHRGPSSREVVWNARAGWLKSSMSTSRHPVSEEELC
jgi:hypothetical protein